MRRNPIVCIPERGRGSHVAEGNFMTGALTEFPSNYGRRPTTEEYKATLRSSASRYRYRRLVHGIHCPRTDTSHVSNTIITSKRCTNDIQERAKSSVKVRAKDQERQGRRKYAEAIDVDTCRSANELRPTGAVPHPQKPWLSLDVNKPLRFAQCKPMHTVPKPTRRTHNLSKQVNRTNQGIYDGRAKHEFPRLDDRSTLKLPQVMMPSGYDDREQPGEMGRENSRRSGPCTSDRHCPWRDVPEQTEYKETGQRHNRTIESLKKSRNGYVGRFTRKQPTGDVRNPRGQFMPLEHGNLPRPAAHEPVMEKVTSSRTIFPHTKFGKTRAPQSTRDTVSDSTLRLSG